MAATTELFVHLVWVTAGRAPWIVPSVEQAIYAAMIAKCRTLGCPPIAAGGVEDHVHILVSFAPAVSVAKLVKEVKGASSHLMTHELSLRRDDVPIVRRVVAHQKEHHRTNTQNPSWEQTEP